MTAATTTESPTGGKSVKPARRRRGMGALFNLLLIIAIIVVIGLFVWAEQQRRSAQQELRQTASQLQELRESSQRTGQEVAQQVLDKVRTHIDVPTDPQPTVATIVDVDKLKEANDFYAQAKNGDNLIITEDRAILFDPDRNLILDVVPVRLNSADNVPDASGSPNPDGSPAASPDASGSPSPAAEVSPTPAP